jgi:hypothetical protein
MDGANICLFSQMVTKPKPKRPLLTQEELQMARNSKRGFIALAGLSATSLFAGQPPNPGSVLSDAFYNTAMGPGALSNDVTPSKQCVPYALYHSAPIMSGCANTAAGFFALNGNTTGFGSTATGAGTLFANTTGAYNTAAGLLAMFVNTTGAYNVATGANALSSNTTGDGNVATGYFALFSNTKGGSNVAYGASALESNTTGNFNTAVGFSAGQGLATGSNNIYIGVGAKAVSGADNYVTVIGGADPAATTYIAGVTNAHVTGAQVYVTANGQLGVLASSERYKTNITALGSTSERLAQLRPVSFHLKTDPKGDVQYGLIAEEVDKVYPELVIRDNEGNVQGVRYDELAPMLLNEVQKEQTTVASLVAQHEVDAAKIASLELQIAAISELGQEMRAALRELKSMDQYVAQR